MLTSLTHIPLFQDLEQDQLALLEPLFEHFSCAPGTMVFEQGDRAAYLHLILKGSVTIHYKPYDGPPIKVTHLGPGDAFGWSAVVGSPYYTSGILSDSYLETVRVRGKDLWELCIENPDTGKIILDRLARVVSGRWKDAHAQIQVMLDQGLTKATSIKKNKKGTKAMATTPSPNQEQQLRGLLERLSAYVEQFHGGSVEYVSFDGKMLKVHLGGACLGCPLSPATLHGWVAGTVHQFFPDIDVVEEK
jgi:Fe-S cluster biogenesis protein NfuA